MFRWAGVLAAGAALMVVVFRPAAHGSRVAQLSLGLTALVMVAVGAALVWRDLRHLRRRGSRRASRLAAYRTRAWLPHAAVHAVALAYIALTAAFLFRIATLDPVPAGTFFLRALALDSGVSPVVPLLLGALVVIAYSTWHLRRLALLGEVSTFEAACRGGAGPDATADAGLDGSAVPGARVGHATVLGRRTAGVRDALSRLAPSRAAAAVVVGLGLLAAWALYECHPSVETVALGARFDWLAPAAGVFDVLFRFLVVTALGLCAWTLYRLLVVWDQARRCLVGIEALPLGRAFRRMPKSVAGAAHVTQLGEPLDGAVEVALGRAAQSVGLRLRDLPVPAYAWPYVGGAEWWAFRAPVLRSSADGFDADAARPLVAVHRALCAGARSGVVELDVDEPAGTGEEAKARAAPPPARCGWAEVAQEFAALYVVDYVAWVLRHVRYLALGLVVPLALTTALLASYPFEPETFVKTVFFSLMAASVVAVTAILVQINRDATVSRITGTTPGEVNWDARLVLNLLVVFAVPALTLLSSYFPQVGGVVGSVVAPALKALGKA
jgi:hypothetical protein